MPVAERIEPRVPDETLLLARLREGDEGAFADLVDRYQPALMSVALRYVGTRSVAEEVVQETWVGLLRGIDEFEGRSSLKTWLFRILVNTAMSRSRRERRWSRSPPSGAAPAWPAPAPATRPWTPSASSTPPTTAGTAAGPRRRPTGRR